MRSKSMHRTWNEKGVRNYNLGVFGIIRFFYPCTVPEMRGQIIINISQGKRTSELLHLSPCAVEMWLKKKHILHFFSTSRRVLVIDARLFGAIAASFYCPQFFRLSYGCVRLCCFHILIFLHHPVLWTTGRSKSMKYHHKFSYPSK